MPAGGPLLVALLCLVASLAATPVSPTKDSNTFSHAVERALEQYRSLVGALTVPLDPDTLDNKHESIEALVMAGFWQQDEQRAGPASAARAAAQLSEHMCALKAVLVTRNEAAIAQHNARVSSEARQLLARNDTSTAAEYRQHAQRVLEDAAGRMFTHTRDTYLRELSALVLEVEQTLALAHVHNNEWPCPLIGVCAGVGVALLASTALVVGMCVRKHRKSAGSSRDGAAAVEHIDNTLDWRAQSRVPLVKDSMEDIAA